MVIYSPSKSKESHPSTISHHQWWGLWFGKLTVVRTMLNNIKALRVTLSCPDLALGPLKRQVWVCLIIVLLGLSLYANTFHSDFVFDDSLTIINNSSIKNLRNLGAIWEDFNTRFLPGLSFALNYQFGKLNVLGYHLVNILLHVINAWLVFRFAFLTFQLISVQLGLRSLPVFSLAFFSSLIFLAHPIQTESVTYVTQRISLMSGFFYLLALNLHIQGYLSKKPLYHLGVFFCLCLGMFTKENTFTLPLTLLVYELVFLNKESPRKLFKKFSPYFFALVLFSLIFSIDKPNSAFHLKEDLHAAKIDLNNVATEINVLRTFLRLLLFPVQQNIDYDYPRVEGNLDFLTIFSFLLMAGLLCFSIINFKKSRMISFCIGWFFITISVEASASAVIGRDMIFEHYLYLPVVGLAMFIPYSIFLVIKNQQRTNFILILLTLIFSFLTYERNKIWKDGITLWEDTIKKSPNKPRAYNNLGWRYYEKGNYDRSIEYYKRALQLDVNYQYSKQGVYQRSGLFYRSQIFINLGLAFGKKGLREIEINFYLKAIALDPKNGRAYSNLSLAYTNLGDYDRAISLGEEALKLNNKNEDYCINLGVAYGRKGDLNKAIQLFKEVLRLNPQNEIAQKNLRSAEELLREKK